MTNRRKFTTIALASAAAALFLAAPVTAVQADSEANVHCYGVNKCKGHNDCKTAANACKGHGACKGQGFVKLSAVECSKVTGAGR